MAAIPWACIEPGCAVLGIHAGPGLTPARCPEHRRAHKTRAQRLARQAAATSRVAAGADPFSAAVPKNTPEPSAVTDEQREAAPRASVAANQWSRRGKIPLDLTGCPAGTAEARIWIMANVFRRPLYAWQKRVLRRIGNDVRKRRAYVQVARKNGKSLLACALILTELILFEESAVYVVSDSEKNLNSALFRELRTLIGRSAEADRAFIVTARMVEYPHTGSFLEMRANNFQATQGINPTMVVMDEVHLQRTDEVWNGFKMAGAAATRFLLVGFTTPGYDMASFAYELYLEAKAGSPGLVSQIFEPEDLECGTGDRRAWVQSNPRLEDDPDFLAMLLDDFGDLPDHEFRRFRMGMWTASALAWMPRDALHRLAVERAITPADLGPNQSVILGFDGSYSGDSTALYGWLRDGESGKLHGFVAGCWENPGDTSWRVPRPEVETVLAAWMNASRGAMLLYDPPYWISEGSRWAVTWPGRVVEFPTHIRARMAPACTAFYSGVMEGSFTHDGDERFERHVANAVVKSSPQGDFITKATKHSPAKIDLAVAAVVGYSVAAKSIKVHHPVAVGGLRRRAG